MNAAARQIDESKLNTTNTNTPLKLVLQIAQKQYKDIFIEILLTPEENANEML